MLSISETAVAAFHADGLRALRQHILKHWHDDFPTSLDLAGPEECARILAEIDAMSRDDAQLTEADLTMLADLMLVDAAGEARKAASQASAGR